VRIAENVALQSKPQGVAEGAAKVVDAAGRAFYLRRVFCFFDLIP
jgi:hypothetical protein